MSHNPDEFIELDFDENDKSIHQREAITKMRGKYTPSMMVNVLNAIFSSLAITPCVFQTQYAIVFTPVTDSKGSQIPNIDKVISDALVNQQISVEDLRQKALIFPVAEEQCFINLRWLNGASLPFPPRNHWVCLHYDPITGIATTLDSRPTLHSFLYSTHQLHQSLVSALKPYNLSPTQFVNLNQNVQFDDIHCGTWTAFNIETLANGYSIEQLMDLILKIKNNDIIEHFIDRVFHQKVSSFIVPIDEEFNLTKPDISAFLEKSLTMTQIAQAINERESLKYSGKVIRYSNPIRAHDLNEVFMDLEKQYAGILISDVDSKEINSDEYSFSDPGRLINFLRMLSFTIEEINDLSFKDVLIYDALIFNVLTFVECQMMKDIHQKFDSYRNKDEEFIEKAKLAFHLECRKYRNSLYPILKAYIQKNIEAQKNAALIAKQHPLEALIPIKVQEKPNSFLRLGLYLTFFAQNKQNNSIVFLHYQNGLRQVIQIDAHILIQSPQKTIHQLLIRMQASGWNLSSTTIFIQNSYRNAHLIEDAPPPPKEHSSYWQGFVSMMLVLLQMLQDLAMYLAQKTTCLFGVNR